MAVGPDEVRRIAALAGVAVSEAEADRLAGELTGILEHVAGMEGGGSRVEGGVAGSSGGPADRPASRGEPGSVRAGPPPSRREPGPSRAGLRSDAPGSDPLAFPPADFAPEFGDGLFLVPGLASHVPDAGSDGDAAAAQPHPHPHRGGGERGSGGANSNSTSNSMGGGG